MTSFGCWLKNDLGILFLKQFPINLARKTLEEGEGTSLSFSNRWSAREIEPRYWQGKGPPDAASKEEGRPLDVDEDYQPCKQIIVS